MLFAAAIEHAFELANLSLQYLLLFAGSDKDPGRYYVLDKATRSAFLNNETPAEVLGMINTLFSGDWKAAA